MQSVQIFCSFLIGTAKTPIQCHQSCSEALFFSHIAEVVRNITPYCHMQCMSILLSYARKSKSVEVLRSVVNMGAIYKRFKRMLHLIYPNSYLPPRMMSSDKLRVGLLAVISALRTFKPANVEGTSVHANGFVYAMS